MDNPPTEFSVGGKTAADVFADAPDQNLARSACQADLAGMQIAIENGASVNASGFEGVTLLSWALRCESESGVEFLLKSGADPNTEFLGSSAVVMAARMENSKFLSLILENGGDPDGEQIKAGLPLMESFYAGMIDDNWRNMELLLDAGADVNALPGRKTVPEWLVSFGLFDKGKEMLRRGYNYRLDYYAWIAQEYRFIGDLKQQIEIGKKQREELLKILENEYDVSLPISEKPESAPPLPGMHDAPEND